MPRADVVTVTDLTEQAAALAERQGKPRGILRRAWDRWMGPGEPLPVNAPAEESAEGPRQWDYRTSRNLTIRPRGDEPELSAFAALRTLATTYDVAAICIRHILNTVSGRDWDIQSRAVSEGRAEVANEAVLAMHRAFWETPDRVHTWNEWVRMALYETLTIDALPLYLHPTLGGGLGAVEIVAGDTVKPLVDQRGRVPDPPLPAYQQAIKGVVFGQWTREQMLYGRMNPRAFSAYGRSPLEDAVIGINTAVRKQLAELAHWSDSNIPRAIFPVALGNATVDQIREMQDWLDAKLQGQIEERAKMVIVPTPGSSSSQARPYEFREYQPTREPDEWELKIVCAAFGVSPSEIGFTADVNRATSSGQENAEERSMDSYLRFVAGLVNRVIRATGDADSEFVFLDNGPAEDVERDARVDQMRLFSGVETLNALREGNGQSAVEGGDEPFIVVGSQVVLVRDIAALSAKATTAAPPPVVAAPVGAVEAKEPPAAVAEGQRAEMAKLGKYVSKGRRRPFVAEHLEPEFAAAVQAVSEAVGPRLAVEGGVTVLEKGE